MVIIKAERIININQVRGILNRIRNHIEQYEAVLGELSDDEAYDIDIQLAEIDDFLFGAEIVDEVSIANATQRKFIYYDYLADNYSFERMLLKLKITEENE